MNSKLIITCFAVLSFLGNCQFCNASAEFVTVEKILQDDDKAIIQRRNGEKWLIEKGVGALSLWRYEGKKALIDSPGLFGGVGSKLILPEEGQEARIWNAELLGDSSPLITRPAQTPDAVSKPQQVADIVTALQMLKYLDPSSKDKVKSDELLALARFQADNKVGETNRIGPKTLAKLAEGILREKSDDASGLALAQRLVASACQLKGVSIVRAPVATVAKSTESLISSVSGGGSIIKLNDGSIYEVGAIDRIDSALWLPGERILKHEDKLINLDNGESVEAQLIH